MRVTARTVGAGCLAPLVDYGGKRTFGGPSPPSSSAAGVKEKCDEYWAR